MATMSALGAEKPVVIFSKSGCCFGHTIKTLIYSFGASPAVHELDELPYGRQLERELSSLRCQPSVPAVFIGRSWLAALMSPSLNPMPITHLQPSLTVASFRLSSTTLSFTFSTPCSSSYSSSSYFDRGTVAAANLGFAAAKWNLKRRVLWQWQLNSDGTTTDNDDKIKIEITKGRRGLTTMVLDVGLVEGRRTERRWDVGCNGKMVTPMGGGGGKGFECRQVRRARERERERGEEKGCEPRRPLSSPRRQLITAAATAPAPTAISASGPASASSSPCG
ncbi:hypothetical protein TEA_013776 [Camellia sinensis var. sinensis]|uniref:Glutaredoxin domain-containing protein n=1 Tax=Camellia sinensis var. sinensis TaxID=542762 RepID=A0A4S4EVS6_CAMSN|nr:hypothetical protein TEA_013776 [Camellia sinensis var. sinensis]